MRERWYGAMLELVSVIENRHSARRVTIEVFVKFLRDSEVRAKVVGGTLRRTLRHVRAQLSAPQLQT